VLRPKHYCIDDKILYLEKLILDNYFANEGNWQGSEVIEMFHPDNLRPFQNPARAYNDFEIFH
jgi:hypothetical protein